MIYLFKLLRLAKQYRLLWKQWTKGCEKFPYSLKNDVIFHKLEDKEHELLEVIIHRGKRV